MSLQVWLPLNKNLKNVGLTNVNVTNNGVTLTTGGIYGNCYSFNGSSYLTFATPVSLSSTGHSICCWLDLTNINSTQYFLGFGTGGIRYGSDNLFLYYYNGQTLTWTYTKVNRFVHVAFVCNSNSVKLYVDGTQIGEAKSLSNGTNTCTLVGKRNDGYYYNGKMNDLRIYDHALNEEDIKRIHQKKELDIVPYSGVKNVLFDRSGLMMGDVVPYNITYRTLSAYFNGSNAAINIPPMTTMNDGGIFTMNVWFYKDGFGSKGWETIFGGPSGFELQTKRESTNSPVIVQYSWGGSSDSSRDFAYELKKWNMLTMVRTTSNSKFYLNGELKITGSVGSIPSGNYWIGSWNASTRQNYKGLVGNFQLYKKELTAEEILKIYNEERNMFLPDEYEELEYIQSDGNQYIDTLFSPTSQTKVEYKIKFISDSNTSTVLIGTRVGSASTGRFFPIAYSSPTTKYRITYGNTAGEDTINFNTDYYGIYKPYEEKATINSVSYSLTGNNFTKTQNTTICLFGTNGYDSNHYCSKGRIYYTKFYENDVMVHNFIPAKRKSDNVIGMYDMVSKQFFTNSGTGSFTGA